MQERTRYILVTRQTRLEELVQRFNTWPQAKFYLEHNNTDPQDYLREHDHYRSEVQATHALLQKLGRCQALERSLLPSYQFARDDVVVVIGQDGLVANTLKYLDGQPVIGINPDPERWEGILLPFVRAQLATVLKGVEQSKARFEQVTFAQATTNDGQIIRAVNDLFIGPQSHTSARYRLCHEGRSENQSSSGIIVSTGFGSTGWLQSIIAGASGVWAAEGHKLIGGFGWGEERLQYAVREPFPSPTTGTAMVFGRISKTQALVVESQIPERGVIFSDGMEQDFIAFNAGTIATVGVAPAKGRLVVA